MVGVCRGRGRGRGWRDIGVWVGAVRGVVGGAGGTRVAGGRELGQGAVRGVGGGVAGAGRGMVGKGAADDAVSLAVRSGSIWKIGRNGSRKEVGCQSVNNTFAEISTLAVNKL